MDINFLPHNSLHKFLTLVAALFFFVPAIFSEEYLREPNDYRSSAMGGTGISSANDTNALYYNPATMANVMPTLIDLISMQAEYDSGGRALYDTSFTYDQGEITGKTIKLDKFFQLLQDNENKIELNYRIQSALIFNLSRAGARIGILAAKYTKLGFNAGDFARKFTDEELVNAVADPNSAIREELRDVNLNGIFRSDSIIKVGFTVPFWRGLFVFGVSYSVIERQETKIRDTAIGDFLDSTEDSDALINFEQNDKDNNRYVDVGIMVRIPGSWRVRLAAVYKNALDEKSDNVSVDRQELAGGISMVPVFGKNIFGGVRLTLAADYRGALEAYDSSTDNEILKKVHAGAELAFLPYNMTYSMLALRAGYNQGYVTYGAETNFALYRTLIVGYSSYGEEIGNNAAKVESRRQVFYASMGF